MECGFHLSAHPRTAAPALSAVHLRRAVPPWVCNVGANRAQIAHAGFFEPRQGYHVNSMNPEHRAVIDAEHLRLLAIFHFVAAGLSLIGVLFSLLYLVLFEVLLANPEVFAQSQQQQQQGPPPEQVMMFFRGFLVTFVIWFLVSAVGNLLSGMFMRTRRHRAFSMIVAGINCLHIPIGTTLGVFTFVVLGRDSVRKLYEP